MCRSVYGKTKGPMRKKGPYPGLKVKALKNCERRLSGVALCGGRLSVDMVYHQILMTAADAALAITGDSESLLLPELEIIVPRHLFINVFNRPL